MARTHWTSAAISAGAVIAALVLNPSPDRHREKIREAVAERSPIAGALGVGAIAAFFSSYHSLGVVSYTKVKDRTLSIGVLGMVFVLQPSVKDS